MSLQVKYQYCQVPGPFACPACLVYASEPNSKRQATREKRGWWEGEKIRESCKEKTAVASVHPNVGQAAGQDTHNSTRGSKKRSLKQPCNTKNKVKPLVLSMQKLLNVLTLDKAEKIHTHTHKDTHTHKSTLRDLYCGYMHRFVVELNQLQPNCGR